MPNAYLSLSNLIYVYSIYSDNPFYIINKLLNQLKNIYKKKNVYIYV